MLLPQGGVPQAGCTKLDLLLIVEWRVESAIIVPMVASSYAPMMIVVHAMPSGTAANRIGISAMHGSAEYSRNNAHGVILEGSWT